MALEQDCVDHQQGLSTLTFFCIASALLGGNIRPNISPTLHRTKVLPAEYHNCICNKGQRLRQHGHSCKPCTNNRHQYTGIKLSSQMQKAKTLYFILRISCSTSLQRRFQISPRMIFTGVKATIPHDCKPSLLEQTPAPYSCVKTFRGKIKNHLASSCPIMPNRCKIYIYVFTKERKERRDVWDCNFQDTANIGILASMMFQRTVCQDVVAVVPHLGLIS